MWWDFGHLCPEWLSGQIWIFSLSSTIKIRWAVRCVSCNVGPDQLFDHLSRSGKVVLQRVRSVEIMSSELSVCNTTGCCFLLHVLLSASVVGETRQKAFCSRGPSNLSEHCTLLKLTGSRVPATPIINFSDTLNTLYLSVRTLSLISRTSLGRPLCSVIYWRKEDVCAASFSSRMTQWFASGPLYVWPLTIEYITQRIPSWNLCWFLTNFSLNGVQISCALLICIGWYERPLIAQEIHNPYGSVMTNNLCRRHTTTT